MSSHHGKRCHVGRIKSVDIFTLLFEGTVSAEQLVVEKYGDLTEYIFSNLGNIFDRSM